MKINFDFFTGLSCNDVFPDFSFQSSSFESLELGYVNNTPNVHFTEVSANLTHNTYQNDKPCKPKILYVGQSEKEYAHFKFKVMVEPKRMFFVREILDLFNMFKFLLGAISGLGAFYALIAFTYLSPKFQEFTAKKIIYKRKCLELRDIALKQGNFEKDIDRDKMPNLMRNFLMMATGTEVALTLAFVSIYISELSYMKFHYLQIM